MTTITDVLMKKIKEIANKKGFVKDDKVDIPALTNEYLKLPVNQKLNNVERRKLYRSIYTTFGNFFDENRNWTKESLNKVCAALDIKMIFVEASEII